MLLILFSVFFAMFLSLFFEYVLSRVRARAWYKEDTRYRKVNKRL